MRFGEELRDALERILEVPVPTPDADPLLFFDQWLAERNLGLVPIASPDEFEWSGYWLARVGEHVVLMFGSPSGPVHDPGGALADGGTIDQAWMLARIDVRLPIDAPYGRDRRTGSVAAVLVAAEAEGPLARVDAAEA